MKTTDVKKTVREKYGSIAGNKTSCCGPKAPSCCGASSADEISRKIGYSPDELDAAPDGANLGLGCGNPVALASLKRNEVVLDLGPGVDSMPSWRPSGWVIEVKSSVWT